MLLFFYIKYFSSIKTTCFVSQTAHVNWIYESNSLFTLFTQTPYLLIIIYIL